MKSSKDVSSDLLNWLSIVYQGYEMLEFKRNTKDFVLVLYNGGVLKNVHFSVDGKWIKTITPLSYRDAPVWVQELISMSFPDTTVDQLSEVHTSSRVGFKFLARKKGQEQWYFASSRIDVVPFSGQGHDDLF